MNAVLLVLIAFLLQDTQQGELPGSDIADSVTANQVVTPSDSPKEPVDIGRGITIALTGMAIVATALVLILGFIASLPRILAFLDPFLPEPAHHHGAAKTHPESQVAEDEAVLAAIGYVLHSRMRQNS